MTNIENSTRISKVVALGNEREYDNSDGLIELHRSKHSAAAGGSCPVLLVTVTVSFAVIIK